MFKNNNDSIEIARVLQHSLTPLSATEVKGRLDQRGVDLSFNSGDSTIAQIQAVLESMPARRVEKLASPGSEDKYRWVFQSRLTYPSLVAVLKGTTPTG
jgi:hypothetical protein